MKVPTPRRTPLGLNMTPMIDVVFLLIIFFLVASHFTRQESSVEVALPESVKPEPSIEDESPRLTLTLPREGEMYVGVRPVRTTDLEGIFRAERARTSDALELRIRAGRDIPFHVIAPILRAAARAGVTNVQFAVVQET